MAGRHSVTAFEQRTRQILAGAPLMHEGELCRFCVDRIVVGELYCQHHLVAVRSKRADLERR